MGFVALVLPKKPLGSNFLGLTIQLSVRLAAQLAQRQ